jgi:hypothetical protein
MLFEKGISCDTEDHTLLCKSFPFDHSSDLSVEKINSPLPPSIGQLVLTLLNLANTGLNGAWFHLLVINHSGRLSASITDRARSRITTLGVSNISGFAIVDYDHPRVKSILQEFYFEEAVLEEVRPGRISRDFASCDYRHCSC